MSNRDDLSELCLTYLKPPTHSGSYWTLDPDALADAILAAGWRPPSAVRPTEPVSETNWRLARSSGYRELAAGRDFTGHMDQGRRTAYYEGFKKGRETVPLRSATADHPTEPSAPRPHYEYTVAGCDCGGCFGEEVRVEPTTDDWTDPEPWKHKDVSRYPTQHYPDGSFRRVTYVPRTRAEYDADTAEKEKTR